MIYVSLVDSSMFFRSQKSACIAAWQHTLDTAHKVMTTSSNVLLCKGHRMPWTGTLNPCWADLKWSKSKVCFVPPEQISKNDEPSSGFRNYLGQFRALSRIYGNAPKKQLMNPEWHPKVSRNSQPEIWCLLSHHQIPTDQRHDAQNLSSEEAFETFSLQLQVLVDVP